MKSLNNQQQLTLFTSLLYLSGFFLFLEWIYPVGEITNTDGMTYILTYVVFCFLISLFQLKWWQSFILKGLGLFIVIHFLFFEVSLFNPLWIKTVLEDIKYNLSIFASQDWYEYTPLFRSGLFLILIWLMSYLIHYWFVVVKRVLLFIIMTFIYLSVLDTFTAYEASASIIRVFMFSFLALGIANFMKRVAAEQISFKWLKNSLYWFIPIIGVILFSTLLGYAAPKLDPKWPDPIAFIQNVTGTGTNSEDRKAGYGEDDSQLGGSFNQDETRVFDVMAKSENYWRIETKEYYTGKGWENSSQYDSRSQKVESTKQIPLKMFSEDVETEQMHASIKMNPDMELPKLIYPYGISEIELGEDMEISYNQQNEDFRATYAGQEVHVLNYSVVYQKPSFDIEKLKSDGEDPDEIIEQYTEIPNNLPERVQDLAEDITKSKETRYDKAVAIESYFGKSNEFTYETKNVPVPRGNTDYVDQFLFESKKGYCDNYSTSMVVMLRTLGIPARWAKGFTSGEDITNEASEEAIEEDYNLYEVTNMNAHSWPEVYFPDVGWVPFEPTQGFDNLAEFYDNLDIEGERDALEDSELETDESESEDPIEDEDESIGEDEESTGEASSIQIKPWHIATGSIVFILLLIVIYRKRLSIQAYIIERKLEKNTDEKTVQMAYHFILKVLKKHGDGKEAQQTLREYAKMIDKSYSTFEMSQLTHIYEQILYTEQGTLDKDNQFVKAWKYFIQKIIS